MPRKLSIDSIKAELASIENLLEEAKGIDDIVGVHQYEHRRSILLNELEKLGTEPDNLASVAIFFSGKPVFGSRGVLADFAADVLKEFQNIIVSVQAFEILGKLGSRGRIPEIGSSNLMITEVVKGSFGFVLDELSVQLPLIQTPLRHTIDLVSNIIEKTADENEEAFEEILPNLDGRSLISLRNFFANMDRSKATLRIVEGDKEFSLDEESIHRGKIRTEFTTIEENLTEIEGILLGFLPEHKKFEFKTIDKEIIYGTAASEAVEQYNSITNKGIFLINKPWRISVDIRIIKPLNRKERQLFKLVEFIKPLPNNA